MKQGSVVVHPGDTVTTGSVLGQVGQSGDAEFPHLHLTVRHNGQPVDPFAPDQPSCGSTATQGLWSTALPYQPGGIQAAGFATEIPSFAAIQAGLPATPLATTAPALVLWAEVYGARAGDSLAFAITAPDGATFLQDSADLTRTQDLLFRATGRKLHAALPAGTYLGTIRLMRKGAEVDRTTTQVSVN